MQVCIWLIVRELPPPPHPHVKSLALSDILAKAESKTVDNAVVLADRTDYISPTIKAVSLVPNDNEGNIPTYHLLTEGDYIFPSNSQGMVLAVPAIDGYAENGRQRYGMIMMTVLNTTDNGRGVNVQAINGRKSGSNIQTLFDIAGEEIVILGVSASQGQTAPEIDFSGTTSQNIYLQDFSGNTPDSIAAFTYVGLGRTYEVGEEQHYQVLGLMQQVTRAFCPMDESSFAYKDVDLICRMYYAAPQATANPILLCGYLLAHDILKAVQVNDENNPLSLFVATDSDGVKGTYIRSSYGDVQISYDPVLDTVGLEHAGILLPKDGIVRYVLDGSDDNQYAYVLKNDLPIWIMGDSDVRMSSNEIIQYYSWDSTAEPSSPHTGDYYRYLIGASHCELSDEAVYGTCWQYNGTQWSKADLY